MSVTLKITMDKLAERLLKDAERKRATLKEQLTTFIAVARWVAWQGRLADQDEGGAFDEHLEKAARDR